VNSEKNRTPVARPILIISLPIFNARWETGKTKEMVKEVTDLIQKPMVLEPRIKLMSFVLLCRSG